MKKMWLQTQDKRSDGKFKKNSSSTILIETRCFKININNIEMVENIFINYQNLYKIFI